MWMQWQSASMSMWQKHLKKIDICAPLKPITVHSKHTFGLSEKTKTLISERDKKENKCTNIPQMDLTEKPIVGFSHSLLEEVK